MEALNLISKKLFTENWVNLLNNVIAVTDILNNGGTSYYEVIGARYKFNPLNNILSLNSSVFNPKKAAAMYFWYKNADNKDASIINYFDEYSRCIDENHKEFNSNYGLYANDGIKLCINALMNDKNSRQACFMINNNAAMSENSIDKLCTNAVMFFIRNTQLLMIIQMRSSNMLTLLPYDAFIFSTWYAKVYNALIRKYPWLKIGAINVHVGSLHFYTSDFYEKSKCDTQHNVSSMFSFEEMCDHNFENILEKRLIEFLK